ncbi:SHOCT domain-containing protein [Streptomyces sp. cmx-4-25]|uniref:SHOCT domain-containing protein n=1 Tax=unclassified Streptomyces TaxID=2593676 RepID=UPI003980C42D
MPLPRRTGRPGLLGTMARTAVITGTANAVTQRMQRGAAERQAQEQLTARAQEQALADRAAARAATQAPPPAPAPSAPAQAPAPTDRVAQLTALADLKARELLTDEEFATEKARVLNS